MEGLGAPWRVAEARALAARVERLLGDGTAAARGGAADPRHHRPARVRARARGPGDPHLRDRRARLLGPSAGDRHGRLPRALANPRDEEALYTVLASPLVGVSLDALVVLAAAARDRRRDPWSVLREPEGRSTSSLMGIGSFWSGSPTGSPSSGTVAARSGVEELIDRALERTGYDLAVLAMPGGQRRLANVRKLMRLAREHEAAHGPDLRGFLELVAPSCPRRLRRRLRGGRESEAPVEGEALDAVRLMTIHRAKGLEFEIVCVADLGPRAAVARRAAAGRARRPLRAAAGRARHRTARVGARLQGARRRADRGRGARGAPAVLRGDDPRPRAADPERRGQARGVARTRERRWRRSDRVDRAGGRAARGRRGDVRAARRTCCAAGARCRRAVRARSLDAAAVRREPAPAGAT